MAVGEGVDAGTPAARLVARLRGRSPLVMGVLNVTPDSFSDGGRFIEAEAARTRARAMVEEGADIIDVGGESTRPGADWVDVQTERERVIPLVEALQPLGCPISVDTTKAEIMAEAAAAGAAMINDVRALRGEGAAAAVAASEVAVCLMHMQGEPRTMQRHPYYVDVVGEVGDFLAERVGVCEQHGIAAERIVVDPGFGFGKTLTHNLELLAGLEGLAERLGKPVLVGMSRKRMIGTILGDAPLDRRLYGSVAAAVIAVMQGARIVRAHDVGATRDALAVVNAVDGARSERTAA